MDAIITLLAQALGVDAKALTEAIESVQNGTPATQEGAKVPFTKKNGEVVYGTPRQVAAWSRFRDNAPAAKVTPTKVTQSTPANSTAKVTIGFRASGSLARRSAYVVADALGLENTPATRKALLDAPKDVIVAQLAAVGAEVEVVPAASL